MLRCTKLFCSQGIQRKDGYRQDKETAMKAPQILPWIAKRAGISEQLALKLWRRAIGEAQLLTGNREGAEFHRCSVDRFLSLVADEADAAPQNNQLTPAPRLTWMWRHQSRISLLSLMAAQNTYRFWQNTMSNIYSPRKAA